MNDSMNWQVETCVGCSALVEKLVGPVHRYMTAAPGCWARYGEFLGSVAGNPLLQAARQYGVDAYAVQHPGSPNPQAIQSVAVHLMSLYAYLVGGHLVSAAPQLLQRVSGAKGVYHWLAPPSFEGARTVMDLPSPASPSFTEATRTWAESVWQAWSAHHAQVAAWWARYGGP